MTNSERWENLRGILTLGLTGRTGLNACCGVEHHGMCEVCGEVRTRWTSETISDFIAKMKASDIINERIESERIKQHIAIWENKSLTKSSQLITLMLDKGINPDTDPQAILDRMNKVIADLKKANYKWMENAQATYEFYTENGFSPHIHIAIEKTIVKSKIGQQLHKKFVEKKKHTVYRVNIQDLPPHTAYDYVEGRKRDEKKQYVEKDEIFRKKHNIQPIMI